MVKIPLLSRRSEPAPTDENLDGRDVPTDTGRDGTGSRGDGPNGTGTHVDSRNVVAERRAAERAAVARAATGRPTDDDSRRIPRVTDTDPTPERTTDGRPVDGRTIDGRTIDGRTIDGERDAATRVARTDRDRAVAGDRALAGDRVVDRPVDRDGDGVPDRVEPPVAVGPKPRASMLATLGLIGGVAGALFVLTGALTGYGIGLGAVGAVLAVLGLMATRRRHIAGKTDALLGIVLGLGAVVLGVLAMTGQFDWPTTDGDWVQRFREWLDSQFVDRF
ncbi:UbiA family prenyltransferase [Micromonospora sp. NPDC048170]|uniref:UbiA family prenyltransferase n=1 Tax=Micromonospora sp. NPDC048170 TaxID=3154819 RepID=UPI0033E3C6D7